MPVLSPEAQPWVLNESEIKECPVQFPPSLYHFFDDGCPRNLLGKG